MNLDRALEHIQKILFSILMLLILLLSLTLIVFAIKSITIQNNIKANYFIDSITSALLNWLALPNTNEVINMLFNYVVLITTLVLVILPLIMYYIDKKKLEQANGIKMKEISQDGNEDIKIMEHYYKGASAVRVISGDFSWLNDMEPTILNLVNAHKIQFISYKGKPDVKTAIDDNDFFSKIADAFEFNANNKKVKCSYIQYSSDSDAVFLYRVSKKGSYPDPDFAAVCIVERQLDTSYLLETLNKLTKNN